MPHAACFVCSNLVFHDFSLSFSQVVCQLGDLVCDCSVIYFLDKCETVCVAVAARVITSVTAVGIAGCIVCWSDHTSDLILLLLLISFFNRVRLVLILLPRMIFLEH